MAKNIQISGKFCETFVVVMAYILCIIIFPLSLLFCLKVARVYQRAVVMRLGRVDEKNGIRGPGLFFILPCTDDYIMIDLRTVSFDVPPQEALSRDSVTVSVEAVVYYRVNDPLKAVTSIEDYCASTRLLAATTLRNVIGTKDLGQLVSDREALRQMMRTTLDEATDPWGIKVERVEIKDVKLPLQLQKVMAAEAEANRMARAKIIAAEGEIKTSQALKEASAIMLENPMALQLRYLQSLTAIATDKNSTIIFPFPMEFLKSFLGRQSNPPNPKVKISDGLQFETSNNDNTAIKKINCPLHKTQLNTESSTSKDSTRNDNRTIEEAPENKTKCPRDCLCNIDWIGSEPNV